MFFQNCVDLIEIELSEKYHISNWKNKRIVIWGMDSLAKTVWSFLPKYGINDDWVFVDDEAAGREYAKKEIISSKDCFKVVENWTDVVVLITLQRMKASALGAFSVHGVNPLLVDISALRMNSLRNKVSLDGKAKVISLREAQLKQLKILRFVHNYCSVHGLRYYLDYGTLLGAVRHKGFIPWDDDLDIAMPMPDYLKLCSGFPRNGELFFDSMYNEMCKDYTVSTLTKIKSKDILAEFCTVPVRVMTGVGVDIFPLCGYPQDKIKQKEYMNEFFQWADIWKEQVVIPYGTDEYDKKRHRQIFEKMMEIAQKYEYDEADYVGPAYFGLDSYLAEGQNRVLRKEWYEQAVELEFEGSKYRAPVGYDAVLKKWYGDYMQLPAEEQRHPEAQIIYKTDYNLKTDAGIWS